MAAKAITLRALEGLADTVVPGAGQALEWLRSGLKAVKIADSLSKGNGVRLGASIHCAYGFGIDISAPFGAERPVPPSAIEPTWLPGPSEPVSIELHLDEGRPADRQPLTYTVESEARWYQLETTSPAPTRVRAGFFDLKLSQDSTQTHKRTAATALALTAPVRDVLGESSVLSPHAIVAHATRLGVIGRHDETGAWYLNTESQSGPFLSQRRRRINVIAYLDPITGFIAVVELTTDGTAAFGYLILDPTAVPDGIEAPVLVVRHLNA